MVGETVVAIGNAYGYEHTVTVGVVSATRRDVSLNKEISYKGLIQTDASINPGNSGGPLVNIHGELIGVNVAIRAGAQGIGFAIPVDTMVRVSSELMGSKRGNVKHGVGLRNEVKLEQTEGIRRAAMVDAVESGSPGSRAGINKGDELLAIEDFQIKSSLDVERALVDKSPGDKVVFHFRRDGSEQKVEVTLEPGKPVIAVTEVVWRRIGLKVQPISSDAVPSVMTGRGFLASIFKRARSCSGSRAITCAVSKVLSESLTRKMETSSITWLLVMMYPRESMMMPVPMPLMLLLAEPIMENSSLLAGFSLWMLTTAPRTFRTTSVIGVCLRFQ